jgi:hypothetical protein
MQLLDARNDNKQPADIAPMPGKQEEKPITQGLKPSMAREDYPFKDPKSVDRSFWPSPA